MTDKEMLLYVLNRAVSQGVIGRFFDANNETTDEIYNTWKAYQREADNKLEEDKEYKRMETFSFK